MGSETSVRERWEAAGQGQVFRFWGELDSAGRERLTAQLATWDPQILAAPGPGADAATLAPDDLEPVEPASPGAPAAARWREAGEAQLAAGRVAVVTVAGGQGTRLGFDGPKGAFPIGPVSDRSLFEVFAQRLRRLADRHGRPVPWWILTSEATDAATRAFFAARGHLGLDPGRVRFLRQGSLPVLDPLGRALLAAPDRLATAPDGHGGVFAALLRSGALDELAGAGVERLFYHHVDNPLVRVADPAYLGLHGERGAEMSCKAVEKTDPLEKTGFLCRRAGRTEVVEYSEIPPEVAGARGPDGALRFRWGSIGIHVIECDFARRVAEGPPLPLHRAARPVTALGPDGRPATVDALKLERFVFDGLARAGVVAVMETVRPDEYSPVKNARGTASPATARRDLSAVYRRWLIEAGLEAPGEGVAIEIDHAHFDGPDDLRRRRLGRSTDAAPHIRIAKGAER
jgi:UDP-N-acetylglucosamine/UDP-N-acetylgalactosamine diphosphorylase